MLKGTYRGNGLQKTFESMTIMAGAGQQEGRPGTGVVGEASQLETIPQCGDRELTGNGKGL